MNDFRLTIKQYPVVNPIPDEDSIFIDIKNDKSSAIVKGQKYIIDEKKLKRIVDALTRYIDKLNDIAISQNEEYFCQYNLKGGHGSLQISLNGLSLSIDTEISHKKHSKICHDFIESIVKIIKSN